MRLRGEEQLLHSNIGQAVFKDHNRLVVYFRQDHISALQTGGSMSSIPTFNSIPSLIIHFWRSSRFSVSPTNCEPVVNVSGDSTRLNS